MVVIVRKWIEKYSKSKTVPPFAMIRLTQVVVISLVNKSDSLESAGHQQSALEDVVRMYRELLLSIIERRLQKPEKLTKDDGPSAMAVYCALSALNVIGMSNAASDSVTAALAVGTPTLRDINPVLSICLETFLDELTPENFDAHSIDILADGEITSTAGRHSIQTRVETITKNLSEHEKLRLVDIVLQKSLGSSENLNLLLTLWHAISACEGL